MKTIAATILAFAAFNTPAHALTAYNSSSFANNASTEGNFLTAIGESVDFFEDFETGYTDGDTLDGSTVDGMTFNSGLDNPTVRSGTSPFGSSNPIGTFALKAVDASGLRFSLSFASAIDYFSFYSLDHGAMTLNIGFEGGATQNFAVEGTTASGNSAEFFGLVGNGTAGDRIVSVGFSNVGGSAGFGVDNISWGKFDTPTVPLPAGFPLLLCGLAAFGWMRRRQG